MSVVGEVRRGRKRRLDEDRASTVSDDEGPHILDLPSHVLEAVLFESCRFRYSGATEMRRARVCPQFGEACVNVLRSGCRKLENDLERDVSTAHNELRKELERGPRRGAHGSRWSHASKLLSLRLFQLQSLLAEVRVASASVWSYATCGVWTYYDGGLLDKYFKLTRDLEKKTPRGQYNVETVVTMRNARRATARYIKKFTKKVFERLTEAQQRLDAGENVQAEINAGLIATSIAVLQTLECGLAVERMKPVIAQTAGGSNSTCDEEPPQYTRLRVQYTLNHCWIGILEKISEKPSSTSNVDQLLQLLVVLRELVWITNLEHLRWQQLKRFIFLFPNASSVCSSDYIFTHNHTTVSEFPTSVVNVADDFRGTRLFFYGHRSPVRYHTADSSEVFLPPGYDARRQFLFDGHVFDYPTDLVVPCVSVEVDMTCETELLPPCLLKNATRGDMPVESQYALEVKVLSREEGSAKTLLNHTFISREIPLPVGETSESEHSPQKNVSNIYTHKNCMNKEKLDTFKRWESGEPFMKIRRRT